MTTLNTGRTSWSDQARDEAFEALRAAMPAANLSAALRCSTRLEAELPHRPELERNLVLVAYGGGKDSAYTLAFVRAMQLILFRVHGRTFRLRVATNRHAGMPRAVMENIAREYDALRLAADPHCELLLIDGNEVTRFDVDAPQREHVVRRNRLDILMTGHRTFADGRPTFCNSCNLSVSNSFGVAASYGEGADLIITGDSPQEQRQYALWVGRLAIRLGAPAAQPVGTRAVPRRILSRLDAIAQSYFTDIHGPDAADDIAERRVSTAVPERLRFFSIYPDTEYASGDHMQLLTGFLGFEFDDHAFSFTESDCGNPALMAHLRGLKAERLFQRSYADGIAEYTNFALDLMQRKDFPHELVATMRARYAGPDATQRMRRAATEYALDTYGLTEEQLVTMACSPFAGAGAGLEQFLRREHPGLADRAADIHALLAGQAEAPIDLVPTLERVSGLDLRRLRVLYGRPLRRPGAPPGPGGMQIIDTVLAGDPHKAVIATQHSTDGPQTLEQISGR
jgi:hypothetical protein